MNTNNFNLTPEEIKYQQALKRVKRIKGFYTHLMVYIVINAMLIILNGNNSDVNYHFWRYKTFNMALFWGVGLAAHGLSVFLPSLVIGKDWEQRKLKEFMDQEKQRKHEQQ